MLRKILVFSLMILVFNLAGGGLVSARTQNDTTAKSAEKIKTKIAGIGTGEKAKVRVKLRDDTILKGYVSAINEESFTLTNKKNGAATNVDYANVKKISHGGLSTAAKIGIAVGVAVPLTIFLTLLNIRCNNEGGCF